MRRQNMYCRSLDAAVVNDRQLTAANIASFTAPTLAGLTGATPNNVNNEFLTVDAAGNYSYRQQLATPLIEVGGTPGPLASQTEAQNNTAVQDWLDANPSDGPFQQWQLYRNAAGQVFIYTDTEYPAPA